MSDISSLESNVLRRQKRLFTFLTSKGVPAVPLDDERSPLPKLKSLAFIAFRWVFPIISVGYKRTLTPQDLPQFTDESRVEDLYKAFSDNLTRFNEAAKKKHLQKKGSLEDYEVSATTTMRALLSVFKFPFIVAFLLNTIGSVGTIMVPLLSNKLIKYVTAKAAGQEPGIGKGVGYAIGESLLISFCMVLVNTHLYYSAYTGSQARAVLIKAVLEKSFKADLKSRHDFSSSKITTMAGTDTAKVDFALQQVHYILSVPVCLTVAVVVLAIILGLTTAVAIAVLSLVFATFFITVNVMVKQRLKSLKFTDARIDKIKEVVMNSKIVKYYSWEDAYYRLISIIRGKETKHLMILQFARNSLSAIVVSVDLIIPMVSFLVLYAIDNGRRTAATVFSSLGLINVVGEAVITFPFFIGPVVDGIISLKRITAFLVSGEHSVSDNYRVNPPSDVAISISDASFVWEKYPELAEEAKFLLKPKNLFRKSEKAPEVSEEVATAFEINGVNLTVSRGELVMVVGTIGSGKSSLLSAISGIMPQKTGDVEINGSVLLCGELWIKNDTIRQNIVFGSHYDEKKYRDVVYACDLESDLSILPARDRTEVGEKGITLSGGQKARINLARSVYTDKDIILLDDVLSAVDARVGKHIMDTCIMGLLKTKTRVLATHQLSFLSYADKVVFMDDGSIDVGTLDEVSERNEAFRALLSHKDRDDSEDETATIRSEEEQLEEKLEEEKLEEEKLEAENGILIEQEVSKENSVGWTVYKELFKLGLGSINPLFYCCVAVFMTVLSTFTYFFVNTWLSFWTSYKFKGKSDIFYIGIYVMLSVVDIILYMITFNLWTTFTIRASRNINIQAVERILHVPSSFMDTTPIGRILNRFTKDTDALDNELVESSRSGVNSLAQVVGMFILQIIYLPWLAIGMPFMLFAGSLVGSLYQASSREAKRLESTQRSKVLVNLSESLSGLNVIKSYKLENWFIEEGATALNNTNEASMVVNGTQRWGFMMIIVMTTAYILLVTLLCVNRVFHVNPSSVGLIISFVTGLPGLLTNAIRCLALIENDMTSFERMYEYANTIPQEAPYHRLDTKPEPLWPQLGAIEFLNVSMQYRPGLPLVLKNVSASIRPREKVGICGRTGAGKSTIISTLFRMTELCGGKITLDGRDIADLGLNELRLKLSIIPQESILFGGTVRRNLDPSETIEDSVLWLALRRAGLVEGDLDDSKGHKFHLDYVIEDGGSNYSLGERQCVAFARALVRNSKVLILDEATSSVDYATDARIQNTIATEFSDCTILCIAHRLRTILKYDRIIVLDQGELKEFDTPLNLYNDRTSTFRLLCDKSKITEADFGS